MKRNKRIFMVLCCLVLAFSGKQLVYAFRAEPTVVYDGSKKEFFFINAEKGDLYRNFKNLVPGDVVKQKIRLKTERINTPTEIYLDADPMSGVKQTIFLQGKELPNSSKQVKIGSFRKDTDYEITVVLEVPKEAGNEIAGFTMEIPWTFYACETTDADGNETFVAKGEVPKTSDQNSALIYIGLAAGAALSMTAMLLRKKES